MHILTVLSLKNRALIALVTIVAAVFGLIGVGSLKQEVMPSVQFPAIVVVTSYPGASPEVVNNDVSGPIETALRSVPQLESTTATSSTGASMVLAQFTYGIDLAVTEQKVERAVSRISQLLPEASDTQVLSGSFDDLPVIQIAVTPAEGETAEDAARLIERIAVPELTDLDGVRDAQVSGARGDRISILPNAELLAAQGLSTQAITDTLQQSGVLIAAGTVTEGDRTLAVQAGSSVHSAEEIAALPLARSMDAIVAEQQAALEQQALIEQQARRGMTSNMQAPEAVEASEPAPVVTIGDVATVQLEQNPEQSISRINGAPALTIAVTKMSAANTVDVSHAVQEKLDELQDQLGGAELSIIFDQAPYVEQSIETLTTEGLLGLLFAVIVILLFLMSVRATLVTAISIPTSVLLTFVGLNFAEYSLNLLTLGALTISIGRVVDDSIVVIENIKRHLTAGSDRGPTIVRAVREVAGAITASTITTVAVFLPMAFVEGMVGELFRPFAFTVTIALAASLLVSLTIVPVLAYWFLRPESEAGNRFARLSRRRAGAAATAAGDVEPETALQRGYRPIIEWTLKRPAVTLLVSVVIFGATVGLAATPLMKTNYLGSDEQNSIGLTQTLAPGTSLDAQLAQAERVETALEDLSEVQSLQVTIGSAGSGMASIFGGGGDGTVSYSITTDPGANQSELQDRIRAAVEGLDDAGEFAIARSGGGMATSSVIEVAVTAPDQTLLAQAAEAVEAEIKAQDGLKQVESNLAQSRPYLSIVVDRAQAAAAGLTEAAVAGQVAGLMQPRQVGQITMEDNTIAVFLTEGVAPEDQAGVAALQIQTALGPQSLDTLATIAVADGPVTVSTENGVRMATVSALPEGDDLGAASNAVNAALDTVKLPAGTNASVGGVLSQQGDAFGQLGLALLAAILIVYVVMVATFKSLLQPLLLLVSVPFAATGAILLLIVTGIPLGVASLIGVLMLIGIVVTNAIVLVDLVNQYRERGDVLLDAVMHGSLRRLRPIVMTALATIFALTPMAMGITGKGGFISQPLAVVVIGGLLSSTVLTLVVLPTLYYLVENRREKWREERGETREEKGAVKRRGSFAAPGAEAVVASGGVGMVGLAEFTAPLPAEPLPAASALSVPAEAVSDVRDLGVEDLGIEDLGFEDPEADELGDEDPVANVFGVEAAEDLEDPVAEDPTREGPSPEQAPPPITGELNWEQLMWQATQEVEEAAGSRAAEPGAVAPGASETDSSEDPWTKPRHDGDREQE